MAATPRYQPTAVGYGDGFATDSDEAGSAILEVCTGWPAVLHATPLDNSTAPYEARAG